MCILEVSQGNNPAVILTAEPTVALDSHGAQQVMELFAKIAHEQNAVVK